MPTARRARPDRPARSPRSSRSRVTLLSLWQSRRAARNRKVSPLPPKPPLPRPIQRLKRIQRWSAIAAMVSIALAVLVYAQTVQLQQAWTMDYRKLQSLQRQERDLRVALEVLKDKVARQAAATDSTLQPPPPKQLIFLKPANTTEATGRSPNMPAALPPATGEGQQPTEPKPIGY
ncbi:hypothetical protein H6G52_00105 [Limnothrix sp. FACHB-881]|uniref:hypothetical protein n=1 Tax=Limnothrix sp. FACHB-881 TaxID=2692819 RepID=UPI001682330E|nr:hypothetical protein [Limnothrix sp. FACHB-881]MBD2633751.1 hypothetical protein [Limnothrix sp. FACHB-881]